MNRKSFFLFVLLSACAYTGFAQHVCDLILTPEGDNLCILEKHSYDFSIIRACRNNTVSYQAYSSSAIRYEWSVTGGTYQLNNDSTICQVSWGEGNSGIVIVEALLPDSTICLSQIQVVLEDKPVAGVISVPNYIVDVNNPEEKWIEVCVGDTLSFVDNSTSGNLPIVDYYWEFPYGVSNNRSISFEARNPGNYPVIHRVYNECGCYDEVLINLIVKDKCPLELSCFGTACAYSQYTYSVLSPECTDYLWNVEGGTLISPQHHPDVVIQWDAPESGFGMLYLDGSSCKCECKSRKSIRIPVISDNVNINGPDTICLDDPYTFSIPLWGATQYSWNISPSTNVDTFVDNNKFTIIPHEKRTFTISVTYFCDFLGCGPYTVTKVVDVKSSLGIVASPSAQEVCIGSGISFTTNTIAASQWTVKLNDSIVHTISAPSLAYTFDTSGIYVVSARNNNYCNEALTIVNVKNNPPSPIDIWGPDTVCPSFAAEYSATPSSSNYYILWGWNNNGTTHTYTGNKVNITFGDTVEDINVYQVDRRNGCRSDATVFKVNAFQLADWPYTSIIRICQGQTITLSSLRDQSDDDVLYEWKVEPANALSVQGSHLNSDVTLLANYSSNLPQTVKLILKRTYCHISRYDTAYVRIGEIDPPTITSSPVCAGEHTAFSVVEIDNADNSSSYWYIGNDSNNPVYGIPANMTFNNMNPEMLHLHYVSIYGCEVEDSIVVTPCPPLPDMHIQEDSTNGTLSLVISDGNAGYSFLWMTGETTATIEASPDDYWCVVTDSACGCTRTFSHTPSTPGCIRKYSALTIRNHCYNTISIDRLNEPGLNYPVSISLSQGDSVYHYKVYDSIQRMMVPSTGVYTVTVYWNNNDTCYFSTITDTIEQAIMLQLQNDCDSHLLVSGQLDDGSPVSVSAIAFNTLNNSPLGSDAGFGSVSTPISNSGLYRIHIVFDNNSNCFIDTLVRFDAPPTIQNIDIKRTLCENTAFIFRVDTLGEGVTYKWDFGDGSWNYGNEIDHVYGTPGSKTITLIVTDPNGCTSTDTAHVIVMNNYLELYQLTPIYYPICPRDSAVIQTTIGDNIYSWSPSDQFNNNVAYVYETGTYMVDITTIQEHCHKQLELNVPYPNSPSAIILCDSTYCFGDRAELIGDVGEGVTYQWYVNSVHAIDSSTNSNFDYHINDTGSHRVILRVTDSNGCTSYDTAYFYVHPTPPAPSLDFCGNRCITYGPVELCSTTGQSLLWSNGTSGSSTLYFTDGSAAAYYIDPTTGCKSSGATILIPEAPDFEGLLTGCYCIDKKNLPTYLPLFTLGCQSKLPWKWHHNNTPIANDTLPPSPSILKIPSVGEYHLEVDNYGFGCQAVSPSLVIESDGCKSLINSITTASVWGAVIKKNCNQIDCELEYGITVMICNGTEQPVCIDDIYPTLPVHYSIVSGIPMMLNPGECQEVTLLMQYDFTSPNSFVFVLSCNQESVGSFIVNLSDWMDCVQPDTCQMTIAPSFVLDQTLSQPNQTAFFNFTLAFPLISGRVISVGCDQGQIIDGGFSSSAYSGLLMMDYGLMTQLVVDSADFCFNIVCCDRDRICVSTVCIPFGLLWEICVKSEQGDHPKGSYNAFNNPVTDEKEFVLEPNPATNWVKVVRQKTPYINDDIKRIEVFSMLGQKVVVVESTNQFDTSPLSSGSYIVKIVTSTDRNEYLRLIKQ